MTSNSGCDVCGGTFPRLKRYRGSSKKYCGKHYSQLMKYGYILERTSFDPNEYFINGDVTEFYVYNRDGSYKDSFFIDTEDIHRVKDIKWSLDRKGYVRNGGYGKYVFLHKMLVGISNGSKIQVDHIDQNKLNNKKSNLRRATNQENCRNKRSYKNNTSGHRGVCRNKKNKNWNAYIGVGGKRINLGSYKNFEDAVQKRLEAEQTYFGDFAPKDK